ncbi:MAG: SDR family oxidoreductase [Acidimicrobiales bacterium]|nr:SDR family oxidoreductase [Acidimicrobiales bacterium]
MTTEPTFNFTGAWVCVTGGTNGIGLAVAHAFNDAGAAVMITGTRPSVADYEHGEELEQFHYESMNMRDPASIDAVVDKLFAMDVLVNNAGANFPDGLDESTPEGFDAAIETNLLGGHRFIRGCEPLLKASEHPGGSAVINVASMSAFRPVPLVPGYGAAKAAVVQMTMQLGLAWATEEVRVNAIAPGLIETNMTRIMKDIPELEAAELAKVPMGRWGQPSDLVPMFLFLASPAAAFITGQTFNIDGGYSVG